MKIVLDWKGPFGLSTEKERTGFSPPTESGVYLWTVANDQCPRISYVGEASNLQKRFYQHVFWTLGGAYRLCGDNHILQGMAPDDVYVPSMKTLLTQFLADDSSLRERARDELCAYRFWWAPFAADKVVREAVESALIWSAREHGEPIQNPRVSRRPYCSPHLRIEQVFPSGTRIGEDLRTMEYGDLTLDS